MVPIRPLVGVEIGTGTTMGTAYRELPRWKEGVTSKPGTRDTVVNNNPVYRMASQKVPQVDLPRG